VRLSLQVPFIAIVGHVVLTTPAIAVSLRRIVALPRLKLMLLVRRRRECSSSRLPRRRCALLPITLTLGCPIGLRRWRRLCGRRLRQQVLWWLLRRLQVRWLLRAMTGVCVRILLRKLPGAWQLQLSQRRPPTLLLRSDMLPLHLMQLLCPLRLLLGVHPLRGLLSLRPLRLRLRLRLRSQRRRRQRRRKRSRLRRSDLRRNMRRRRCYRQETRAALP